MASSGPPTTVPARSRSVLRRRLAAGVPVAAALAGTLLTGPAAAAPTAPSVPSVPSAPSAPSAASGNDVYVWATGVNLRPCPRVSTTCRPTGVRLGREYAAAYCQAVGDRVVDGPYENTYWVQVAAHGQVGWISAVYVRGGDNNQPVPGVPGPDSCV
ncbi:hypothetical protein [Streptomyces sp. PsTaAH-124]|uniref:hypothetical protein n=1 Tax=Streptomyces sp. PsTaAH-124 TaxID=1157638 RepID=UPI000369D93B|nr:hypothetical protein [Streptomyces sp. PsTaAH-124]